MKYIQINARFRADDLDTAEDLISDIFFSFNLKGVVCNVPIEEPDEGFGHHTLIQPEIPSITGYLPDTPGTSQDIETIKARMAALCDLGITVDIHTEVVDEKDWENAWKDYFDVTPITGRITVKPDWKPYTPREDEIILHLDPGMAFGTGTHPTTAMCLQMIEKYIRPGDTFLDIGTGSGILMVAASKLGSGNMVGIDTDPVAVDVAGRNLDKNSIPQDTYTLMCGQLEDLKKTASFKMIAANIIAGVITAIAGQIAGNMDKNSIAIFSGIIMEQREAIIETAEACGLVLEDELQTDEWVALAVRKADGA